MNSLFRRGLMGLLAVALFSAAAFGQSTEELIEKADKQYSLYAFNLAVKTYRSVLEREPNHPDALARLADCYRQLNQPEESLKWFEKASQSPSANPFAFFNHGKALMSVGKYAEAKSIFQLFANSDAEKGSHYAAMCDFAIQHKDGGSAFLAKNEPANSSASDFGPAFWQSGKVVWASSRKDMARKSDKKNGDAWDGNSYNQLFVSQRDANGFLAKPVFLKNDLQNNYNEAPVTLSAGGQFLAFSRNNFVDGSRQVGADGVKMTLYTGEFLDGQWANVKPYAFSGNASCGYPAFSPDGKILFFASDREGGFGGWDIWASAFDGQNWGSPENLGPNVNSKGDEIAPFFDGKNLFFSSDWHFGFGGMDVFRAELDGNSWSRLTHMGPQINSPRDDYGFIFDEKMNVGYLASNRTGGKGNEDIYRIARATDDYQIQVVAVEDKKPIAGATVDFSTCGGATVKTDATGKAAFSLLQRSVDCQAVIRAAGRETLAIDIFSGMKSKNMIAALKKGNSEAVAEAQKPIEHSTSAPSKAAPVVQKVDAPKDKNYDALFAGQVVNAETKGFLQNVIVRASTQPSGPIFETSTDENGRFGFNLEPQKGYRLTFTRAGFAEESRSLVAETKARNLGLFSMRDAYSVAAPTEKVIEKVAEKPAEKPIEKPVETKKEEAAKPVEHSTPTPPTSNVIVFKPETASQTKPPVVFTPDATKKMTGFAVQLASIDGKISQEFLKNYAKAAPLGNLYGKPEGSTNKVRVGIFLDRKEAEAAWAEARKLGYKSAFVVPEKDFDESLLVKKNAEKSVSAEKKPEKTTEKPAEKADEKKLEAMKPVVYSDEKPKAEPKKEAEQPAKSEAKPAAEPPVSIIAHKKEDEKPADEPLTSRPRRWAVQVAALSSSNEGAFDMTAYASLFEIGHVYSLPENEVTKVRLGVWESVDEAEAAQKKAVKKGFKDAIVMEEKAIYRTEKLVIKPKTVAKSKTAEPAMYSGDSNGKMQKPGSEKTSPYKVRIAALSKSKAIDEQQIASFGGSVEKKKEGKSTVVYLTDFSDLEAAIAAKNAAAKGGFADAYVVKDEKGKLVKVQL